MIGDRSFEKLPGMLHNNPEKKHLLSRLEGPLEECGMPTEIVAWIIKNLDQVTLQTHALINFLWGMRAPHPEEYLALSTVVVIGDCLEEFVDLYSVNRHWILDQGVLFKNISSSRHQASVELDYMAQLLNALCTRTFRNVMQKRKDEFITVPLKDWVESLREARVEAEVQDVLSVEDFLEKLLVDEDLEKIETADIRKNDSKIRGILKQIKSPPNNLQFGIAQAAVDLLDRYPRQIFVLPCGGGKSRVAASIALLLLTLNTTIKKIHMVYLNEVLRRKDQEDYQDLWAMMPNAERVEYHANIDFIPG